MDAYRGLLQKLFWISLIGAAIFNITDTIMTFIAVEICHYPELGGFNVLLERFGLFAYPIKVAVFLIFIIVVWRCFQTQQASKPVWLKVAQLLISLVMLYAMWVFADYTIGNIIGITKCLVIK